VKFTKRRWSDEQINLWPLTYARDKNGSPFSLVIDSGDDENKGCHLRLRGFGHTLLIELPPIVRPWRQKIVAHWDEATVTRLGRDWYWDVHSRQYGFQISESGFLQVFLGRHTHDSATDQSWCKHLPFTRWRFVRFSLYDTAGNQFWTHLEGALIEGVDGFEQFEEQQKAARRFEEQRKAVGRCPIEHFAFDDFDGERITALCHIEEREWLFGEGWFRWLSLFRKPKVSRALAIRFSKETGPRKGSWKGGTIEHGIEMLPGELHEAAFRRYCAGNQMEFVDARRIKAELLRAVKASGNGH
jgi:hypothetical protein